MYNESSLHGSGGTEEGLQEEDSLLPGSQSMLIAEQEALEEKTASSWLRLPKFLKNLHFRRKASTKNKLVQMSSKQYQATRINQIQHNTRFLRKMDEAKKEGKKLDVVDELPIIMNLHFNVDTVNVSLLLSI